MTGFITADGADYLMNLMAGIEQPVSEYYVALVTAPIGTAESGDELAEPVDDSYFRAQITNGPENFSVAYGAMTNITEVYFPLPTEEGWPGIVGWALCDALTEGRALYAGDLEPFDVADGEQCFLAAGSITLSLDLDGWRETT